jgi:hypothetical protein
VTTHILCNEFKKQVPVFEAGIAAGFLILQGYFL